MPSCRRRGVILSTLLGVLVVVGVNVYSMSVSAEDRVSSPAERVSGPHTMPTTLPENAALHHQVDSSGAPAMSPSSSDVMGIGEPFQPLDGSESTGGPAFLNSGNSLASDDTNSIEAEVDSGDNRIARRSLLSSDAPNHALDNDTADITIQQMQPKVIYRESNGDKTTGNYEKGGALPDATTDATLSRDSSSATRLEEPT